MAKTKEIKAKKNTTKPNKLKVLIGLLAIILAGLLAGAGIKIKIDYDNLTATVEYVQPAEDEEKEVPTPEITNESKIEGIETGLGEIKLNGEEIPTVEAVEANGPVAEPEDEEVECPEGEECGRGAGYPVLNVSSPQAFANDTLGKCLDVDGVFGSQCYDSMSAYFYNYAGHVLYTCGTGAAKGTIADGCWQKNATDKFVMIWNAKDIQAGDIAVFSTGQWGHIGMAMGGYNNGYFTLLGQNQGGEPCPGGGAAGNIINISTRDFIGAFRPKIYIKPEPKPEPKPTPTPKNPDTSIVKE